jgi:hypothetical protein
MLYESLAHSPLDTGIEIAKEIPNCPALKVQSHREDSQSISSLFPLLVTDWALSFQINIYIYPHMCALITFKK